MSIETFGDIPNLYAAWTTVDSAMLPDSTLDGLKTSITSFEQGAGISPVSLVNSHTNNIVLSSTDTVGAMPGLTIPNATDAGLYHLWEPTGVDVSASGITVAIAAFHRGAVNSTRYFYGFSRREGRDAGGSWRQTNSGIYDCDSWGGGGGFADAAYNTTTPQIRIISSGTSSNSGKAYLGGVPDANNPMGSSSIGAGDTLKDFMLGNVRHPGTAESSHASYAVVVIYTRQITDAEAVDLNELIQYYVDNGEAPGAGPPTTVAFGPVTTNDDSSVTAWQWEESADGNTWANVGTILTDVSGATTTTLTVNSAPTIADQTQVRCRATSTAVPAGVVSHTATLTVVSQ